jgi:chemotaxis protein methyltransferase CheR
MEDMDYALFVRKVKEHLSLDLASYKETQMKRRLTSLRDKRGFPTFAAYFKAIMQDERLLGEFKDRVTINVSEFWRNQSRWEVLEKVFLPEFAASARTRRLKCWSAACSSGEEPYTLAMILDRHGFAGSEIRATDIDAGVLEKARAGRYAERSVREVPKPYLDQYFVRDGQDYLVIDRLKRMVRFEQGNLLLDPFDRDYDLIICRNVMIYFTEPAKQDLYQRLADALRPGGILFVGSTEQIFTPSRFGLENAESFFYRKKA